MYLNVDCRYRKVTKVYMTDITFTFNTGRLKSNVVFDDFTTFGLVCAR